MIALLLAAVSQTSSSPVLTVSDGKPVSIRSFDIGVSSDLARLKATQADLVIVRFQSWNLKANEVAKALRKGPAGRRVVLVEFPVLGASPKNGLLWRADWDVNSDGKPDEDAPNWLRQRNAAGVYPFDTSNQALRQRLVGPKGLIAAVTKAGFDGIVISSVEDPTQRPGVNAKLLADVMFEGRKQHNGFIVMMSNPGKMMDFPVVRNYMDGFVADGLFFGHEEPGKPSNKEFVSDTVDRLEWAIEKRKVVLSIAYTANSDQVSENKRLAREHKFIPLSLSKRLEEPVASVRRSSR